MSHDNEPDYDYNARVGTNCIVLANQNVPGVWIDPVNGKKLHNDAALDEAKVEAYKKGRIDEAITCENARRHV